MMSHPLTLRLTQIKQFIKKLWFKSANVSVESLASDKRVRQVGLVYSVYRFVIAIFLLLTSYAITKSQSSVSPTFTESLVIGIYLILSLFLLALFYIVPNHARRQLTLGFVIDIILLAVYELNSPIGHLQVIFLYMITVAASFMLLTLSHALPVVFLGILTVTYRNVFFPSSEGLAIYDGWLLSICLMASGFLSWSISQRLSLAEASILTQTQEVEKLNILNRTVVKNMVNGVLIIDKNRNIVMINKSAERLLRLPFDVDECDTPAKLTDVARYLVKAHPDFIYWYRNINPNAPVSWVYRLPPDHQDTADKLRINNKPLSDHGQLLIIEDIEREQSHAQTLKLASLGELSASIAHEIRNPLNAISQASQMLIEDMQDDDPNQELYKIIFNQTKRVNNIIADILSLSRQEMPNQSAIKIQLWLDNFIHQHYPNESIAVIMPYHCHDDMLVIYFDPSHLEQVLVNLTNNALRHTVPTDGEPDVALALSVTDNAVFIDVLDNGDGVPDENLPQLFHPFFTTSKKGTGLGLYLSQSFSEANNAKIRYLRVDNKSCFRLIASRHPM